MRQPQAKRLGELPCETLGIETAQKLQVQEDGCHGATRRHTYAGHQLAKLFCEALFCTFVVLLNSILNSVPSYIPTSKLCIIDCSRVIIDRGSLIYQTLTQRFAGFAFLVMVFVGLFLGLSRSPRIAMFVGTINDLPSSDSASHAKTPLVLVSHALNISP